MIFADVALAARIERAEAHLVADCAAAIGRRRREAGATSIEVRGGVAAFAGENSPLNKVAGLGFAGEIDERDLANIERIFTTHGAPVQVEISTLASPAIVGTLSRRGYRLVGFENVLGLRLPIMNSPAASQELRITVSDDHELETWIDTVVTGFASADTQGVPSHENPPREAIENAIRETSSVPGYTRFLARWNGAPAGGASMRMFEGVAQLCGAATLPAFRRRGIQSALLSDRLRLAGGAGCDLAVITTLPGSKSHENSQKRGFELLFSRAIMVLPPPGSAS